MTLFVAHAPADKAAAEALEKFIERRGQFVELDDGQTAMRPVQPSDAFILLVSKDFVFAPTRLRLEQRALDAWAAGRLVLVKLDHGIAPVGLRDLPMIDASFEAQREFTWQKVVDAARATMKAKPPASDTGDGRASGGPDARQEAKRLRRKIRGANRWSLLIGVLLALPGIGALAVSAAIFLVNRIGPTPGTFADLVTGIDAFGAARGVPHGVTPIVFAVAIAVTLLAPIAIFFLQRSERKALDAFAREHPEINEDYESAPVPKAAAPEQSDAVFVSYASANASAVIPVIEAAKTSGRKFWVDQQGIGAGDGWAGEIVKAIRSAKGVVVMCSKAAFESDHVKREIYLADRYHKKVLPVFIEDAQPPEDFEYFFAGVQWLKLFETPEGERDAAFSKALGATA